MKTYYKELLEALEIESRIHNLTHEESNLLYSLADYNVLKTISDWKFDNGENNEKYIFSLNEILGEIEKEINEYIDKSV